MEETTINQETIRSYLLGDLAETERAALEDRFLGNALIFEQIEDAENDLVDDYVSNRLSRNERASFEAYYLALPEKRTKVEAAGVLRKAAGDGAAAEIKIAHAPNYQPGFLQSIREFFASLKLAPVAISAAVLLIIIGGLWLVFRQRQTNDIAYSPTPQPPDTNQIIQPSPTLPTPPAANTNISEEANRTRGNSNQAIPLNTNTAPKETPRQPVEPKPSPTSPQLSPQPITLALVAGLVRGGSEANKLVLPKNAGQVRLIFDLPAAAVKGYRNLEARIETVTGEKIWSGKIKPTGGRAAVNLPAKTFASEDYLLIVSGINDKNENKELAQFYFNAKRK